MWVEFGPLCLLINILQGRHYKYGRISRENGPTNNFAKERVITFLISPPLFSVRGILFSGFTSSTQYVLHLRVVFNSFDELIFYRQSSKTGLKLRFQKCLRQKRRIPCVEAMPWLVPTSINCVHRYLSTKNPAANILHF